MPSSMADQFRGLPMGDLIGGPLMAAADAQVRLANSTANFIQQVGFTPGPNTKLDDSGQPAAFDSTFQIRTAPFKFARPQAGAPVGTDGLIPTETVELDVPLLAIVKIPSLSIDTVDITFDMEVKNSESSKDTQNTSGSFSADASVGWGPFSLKVHVEGSVSSAKENVRSSDQSAKYHVEVHASDKGMPEGLARVLDIMNSAIAPKKIAPTPTDGTATAGGGETPAAAPVGPGATPVLAASDVISKPMSDGLPSTLNVDGQNYELVRD